MFHHLDPLTVRAAFPDAAEVFLATVAAVRPSQWDQPGFGEWTVRELTAHALRAFEHAAAAVRHHGRRRPRSTAHPAYYRAVARGARRARRRGRSGAGRPAARLVDPMRHGPA